MSGITAREINIINNMLSEQRKDILNEVKDVFKNFKEDIQNDISNLNGSVLHIAELAASAKETAEKVRGSIEGNGAIGLKTQIKNNNEAIKNLAEKIICDEKERLKKEIIESKSCGDLKEKKYNRRAEDKRAKRKDILLLAGVLLTVIGNVIINLI